LFSFGDIKMAELKVIVPDELEPELNWSEFIAKTIELKAFELELNKSNKLKLLLLKALTSKSKLSKAEAEKFAVELGNKIKEGRLNELKGKGLM
jgi:hypothetical protein